MDREGEFALLVGADLAIDLVERFGVPAHRLDRERDIDVARIRYRLAGIERFHQRQRVGLPLYAVGEREQDRLPRARRQIAPPRSEEHTSELQSLIRITYAVFRFTKKTVSDMMFVDRSRLGFNALLV